MPLIVEPKKGGRFCAWTGDSLRLVAGRGRAISANVDAIWSEAIDEETRQGESFTWIACRDLVGNARRFHGLVLEANELPELKGIPETVRLEKVKGMETVLRPGHKRDLQAIRMRVASVFQCARRRVLIVLMPLKGDRAY